MVLCFVLLIVGRRICMGSLALSCLESGGSWITLLESPGGQTGLFWSVGGPAINPLALWRLVTA